MVDNFISLFRLLVIKFYQVRPNVCMKYTKSIDITIMIWQKLCVEKQNKTKKKKTDLLFVVLCELRIISDDDANWWHCLHTISQPI